MMDHLTEAREYAQGAQYDRQYVGNDAGQAYAQLAIAHALIALVERLDQMAEDAADADQTGWRNRS